MGKPGRRLTIPPKPKTEDEEENDFCERLWETYCEYRTEEHLPGVKKCDDIIDQLKAVKAINGMAEAPLKPEDDFVIRKVCVCVCARTYACMHACMRACVRACECADFVIRKGVRVYLKDSSKPKRRRLIGYDRGDS